MNLHRNGSRKSFTMSSDSSISSEALFTSTSLYGVFRNIRRRTIKGRTGATMADRVRRGHQDTSPFHAYLEHLFCCHIDVQWTTGRLNYINGYTTKAHDSMDFRLDSETFYAGSNGRWLTAYRLLCRKTVCIPEVALWFHEAEPMIRSFRIWKCYAPIPWACD